MSNFRTRRKKALADVLTGAQIELLVEGPSPFSADYSNPDAAVIAEFGSVEHFRVIFEAYKDDLFKLAAPDRPWSWWALEGPGMPEPPAHLRIVRRPPCALKQVPPVMVGQKFLEKVAR